MDYLVISPSDECLDPERPYRSARFSLYTDSPTTYDDPDDYFSKETPHSKFIFGSFIPLPSIIASPACTPTPSSSGDHTSTDSSLSPHNADEYRTAPSTPTDSQSYTAPTCIYTPSTPPPNRVKRSVTCFARPPSQLSSSASFPASISPHEKRRIMKRSASVPTRARQMHHASVQNTAISDAKSPSSPANLLQRTLIASLNAGKITGSNPRKLSMRRSKAIFHIAPDAATDIEDDVPEADTPSPVASREDESPEDNNFIDSDAELSWLSEKAKDDLRRYYALKELLATEVGYLLHLRALVNVYLRLLPSLVCRSTSGTSFTRASSFTASPWASSNTSQTHGANTLPDTNNTSTVPTRSPSRLVFSEQEIDLLTRNAHELLQLHEQFVEDLRTDLLPLGFHMDSDQTTDDFGDLKQTLPNTDAAIHSVSTKFATEASRFASYESFCAGHPEALDLARKAQAQHPVEWDAFEHRCALLIRNMDSASSTPSRAASEQHGSASEENVLVQEKSKDRARASSLSSVEGTVRTLGRRTGNVSSKEGSPITDNSGKKDKGPRLTFDDYLIKPVQRICKYPLIMDQLKHGRSLRSKFPVRTRTNTEVVVESAAQAMRHVATAVDLARHKQDVTLQSSRIASRLVLSLPPSPSSGIPIQALSQSFVSSLGTCLLVGSLDVIHFHSLKSSASSVHAKYLGAFLYSGGYLILAKISKAKVYEPKHWFSLADFEVSDVEDDSMLPCSIRLTSKEHHFELAAACQRERDLWYNTIQEALEEQPQEWINEPIPSIRCDGKGDLIPSALDDGPFELVNALPTIQSNTELASCASLDQPDQSEPSSAISSESSKPKSPKIEVTTPKREVEPPSRRSSTASVKAIFSPNPSESDTIIVRRSSASARSRVDQGLQDVISPPCLKARSHAFIQDEELFQVPKSSKSSFVRSQSGLSVASLSSVASLTKGRLARHESFRVVRRKSLLDNGDSRQRPSPITAVGSTPRRYSYSRTLQLTTIQGTTSRGSSPQSASPSSSFLVSSLSSLHNSLSKSSSQPTSPSRQPELSSTLKMVPPIKTSRSLVSNVRDFFSSRSSSTTPPMRTISAPENPSNELSPRKLRKSLHRRARSIPESENDSALSLPAIEKLAPLDLGQPLSTIPSSPTRSSQDIPSGPKGLLPAPICLSPNEIDPEQSINQHRSLLQCMKA